MSTEIFNSLTGIPVALSEIFSILFSPIGSLISDLFNDVLVDNFIEWLSSSSLGFLVQASIFDLTFGFYAIILAANFIVFIRNLILD